MNKSLLMLASLAIGTAAFAQTTPAPTPDMAPQTTPAPDSGMAPPPVSTTPPETPAPDPATATPAPPPAPEPAAAPAPAPVDTSIYPACSRTVKDKCVQRGGR
ncbi:hypothetical protein [Sphingomonas bacterium]|uniref:hypothetical protein n=1 Tax=Sphingomonas bacterium TaxID=1895847 RepID=UPI00157695F6|nr:hypothetical protein [Sphingomonas bacterium]